MSYNFSKVEEKWQKKWYEEGTFNAKNDFKNFCCSRYFYNYFLDKTN